MVKFHLIRVGLMGVNCVILSDEYKEATIIDPGSDYRRIDEYLTAEGLTPLRILCTHGHFDHVGAAFDLKDKYHIPLYIHPSDGDKLKSAVAAAEYYGIRGIKNTSAEEYFEDGDEFGEISVIHTPGHSEGSVSFYLKETGLLLAGDTLFKEGVGRADFPDSNPQALMFSIQQKLYTLPDNTVVIPGHGEFTSIGNEKSHNPYVR